MRRTIGWLVLGFGAGSIHFGLALMILGACLLLHGLFDEEESPGPGLQEPDGGRRGD